MSDVLQDLSRVRPAPTVRRETTVLVISVAVFVVAFGGAALLFPSLSTAFAAIGGALVIYQIARWIYTVKRGDVPGAE